MLKTKKVIIGFLLITGTAISFYDGPVSAANYWCDCSDADSKFCSPLPTMFTCGFFASLGECLANCY